MQNHQSSETLFDNLAYDVVVRRVLRKSRTATRFSNLRRRTLARPPEFSTLIYSETFQDHYHVTPEGYIFRSSVTFHDGDIVDALLCRVCVPPQHPWRDLVVLLRKTFEHLQANGKHAITNQLQIMRDVLGRVLE